MRQILYYIEVVTGKHTAKLRTIDYSLAKRFLKDMARLLMEQVEAEEEAQ